MPQVQIAEVRDRQIWAVEWELVRSAGLALGATGLPHEPAVQALAFKPKTHKS
jgi:hypothetical protein